MNNMNSNATPAAGRFSCPRCCAPAGQPCKPGCAEAGLISAVRKAIYMLAQVDVSKVPLAVPAAIGVLRCALDAEAVVQAVEAVTPLDYRAQGREEALAVILALESEEGLGDYVTSSALGDSGDYTYHWDEAKLRALLHIGDCKHDAYDRAEAMYYEAQGVKDEAERMMLMVKRAPHFQPLHEFLAKHQAWDLMHALQSPTPDVEPEWLSVTMAGQVKPGDKLRVLSAAPPSESDRLTDEQREAARYRWLRDKSEPGICAFYLSVGKAFHEVKFKAQTVDEAIDAQILAQQTKKGGA